MSDTPLRVGLDLDGSLESLGNSMNDLADALVATGECSLVRFHSQSRSSEPDDVTLRMRRAWSPLWRSSRGPSIDRLLPDVDIVHLAGRATPPTKQTPLVISVDDLRPLREESKERHRITQLRRATERGAVLVASTRSASHEVIEVLGATRSQVIVVPPAVPLVQQTVDGTALVVNLTGVGTAFLNLAPDLLAFVTARGAQVVVVASAAMAQRIRSLNLKIDVRARRGARQALSEARVVLHISDGARFPSFAIAALAAGVPTIARATTINRELLGGAAALTEHDAEVVGVLSELWENPARRSIAIAAGLSRAVDFAPATAARAYVALYREVVRGFGS